MRADFSTGRRIRAGRLRDDWTTELWGEWDDIDPSKVERHEDILDDSRTARTDDIQLERLVEIGWSIYCDRLQCDHCGPAVLCRTHRLDSIQVGSTVLDSGGFERGNSSIRSTTDKAFALAHESHGPLPLLALAVVGSIPSRYVRFAIAYATARVSLGTIHLC